MIGKYALARWRRRSGKLIALTFDDGPSRFTGELLDGLRDRGAAATFFMTGKNGIESGIGILNGHEALLARMWEEGHQLANHTCRHADWRTLSEEEISSETAAVEELLFGAAGGRYSCFVRTPGGVVNQAVRSRVSAPIIRWSVDPEDWKYRDADRVCDSILSHAENGSIVLTHDIYKTSVEAALRAIDALKKQGFAFVTVAELLRRTGVFPLGGEVYSRGNAVRFPLPAYEAPSAAVSSSSPAGTFQVTCSGPKGLSLYYTTDGSFPRLSDRLYTGPVFVEPGAVFTAVGIDKWGTRTAVFRTELAP